MLTEAVTNHYDGYNLDWEVGNTGHDYSDKLGSFLVAFREALHSKGMTLSPDLGGWYVQQWTDSGANGFVDFTTLSNSVDALKAVDTYGYRAVAIWPAYSNVFLDETAISPSGSTWYSLLAAYLAQ